MSRLFISNLESSEEEEMLWEEEPEPEEEAPPGPSVSLRKERKYSFGEVPMELPATMGIFGRSGSGKTCLTRAFLRRFRDSWKKIFLITGTQYNGEYKGLQEELGSKLGVLPMTALKSLSTIIKIQERVVQQNKKFPICVILDNFVGHKNLHMDPNFELLASSGRHLQITTVILAQRAKKMPPVIRDNLHYLWVSRVSRQDLETIAEYQDQYPRNRFWEAYDAGTKEQYSSLLIQNRNPREKNCYFLRPVPV